MTTRANKEAPARVHLSRRELRQPELRRRRILVYACLAFGFTPPGMIFGGPLLFSPVGLIALILLQRRDKSPDGRSYLRWTLLLAIPATLAFAYSIVFATGPGAHEDGMVAHCLTRLAYILGMGCWLHATRTRDARPIRASRLFALSPLVVPLAWTVLSFLWWIPGVQELNLAMALFSVVALSLLPFTKGVTLIARHLASRTSQGV